MNSSEHLDNIDGQIDFEGSADGREIYNRVLLGHAR